MIDLSKIPKSQMDSLCKFIAEQVIEYYSDPVHQKEYEERHFKKYGHYPTDEFYMKKGVNTNVATV